VSFLQKVAVGALVLLICCAASFITGIFVERASNDKAIAKQDTKAVAQTTKIENKNEQNAAKVAAETTAEADTTKNLESKVQHVQIIHVPQIIRVPQIIHDQAMGPAPPAPATMDCPAAITHADGVLIDAAATGIDNSATGPEPDGPPIPAQILTSSVIDNYGSCRKEIIKLTGLQQYVTTVLNAKLLCPN
jgi:hypothetical protein